MKKILVTTDFSSNSKSALLFAIQLASQDNYKLTFFHSYEVLRPTSWSEPVLVSFEKSESAKIIRKLNKFVNDVYKSLGFSVEHPECVVKSGAYTDRNIMDYAHKNKYSFICISRKGRGKTARLFGSNTSTLIKKSKIPLIAIPSDYKKAEISDITYASDLLNLDDELEQVVSFTGPLGARVELLHFKSPIDYLTDASQFNAIKEKLEKYQIKANYETLDYEKTLIANINKVIKLSKPSLLIMFTDQNRTLFERIFMSSISAEFSSMSKVPLLVFIKD